jgi:hypothetical protein
LGFKWKKPAGSGLQSIIWRSQWEASGATTLKRSLLTYNANDCEVLEVVANKLQLQQLSQNPNQLPDIILTASLKWKHPFGFERNKFALYGPRYHQQGRILGLSTGEDLRKVEWMRAESS